MKGQNGSPYKHKLKIRHLKRLRLINCTEDSSGSWQTWNLFDGRTSQSRTWPKSMIQVIFLSELTGFVSSANNRWIPVQENIPILFI